MEPAPVRVTEVIRPDDQALVRRASRGDADAFDALAASKLPDAFRLASAIVGSGAAAADATQNALLAAWRELPRLRDVERFDSWFLQILVNECRMQVRHESRLHEIGLGDADPRPAGPGGGRDGTPTHAIVEVLDLLEGAFEGLEPDDRAMVVLHDLEDRPLAEIAALLHMPVGTVKWRLHEAREVMHRALQAVG